MKTLQDKIIALLLALVMAFGGVAWAQVTSDITDLKKGKTDLEGIVHAIDKQTAVFEERSRQFEAGLQAVRQGQVQTQEQLQLLADHLQQNTRAYEIALRQYRELLDRTPKPAR